MTSHDVVSRCRRVFGQRRVGHAGTLDPDATGVLLVGLGQATRLLRFLSPLPKSYTGEVALGVATSTLDAAGAVVGRWDMAAVTPEQVAAAAARFVGEIEQAPPMVSAVKVGGKRLHELARAGVEVERAARRVTVYRFDVAPTGADPLVYSLAVECSTGTYVRTLAADLGTALGGGAHLRALRRTAIGPFDAPVPLDAVTAGDVLPPAAALPSFARVVADGDLAVAVGHGRVLPRAAFGGDGPWAVVGVDGRLLAVYEPHTGETAKPAVVLT